MDRADTGGTDHGRGFEEASRRIATLSHSLDFCAAESMRCQYHLEALARSVIARTDMLLHHLRPAKEATAARASSAHGKREMIVVAQIDGRPVAVTGNNFDAGVELTAAWRAGNRGSSASLLQAFTPGMLFADVGAGIGVCSVLVALLNVGRGPVLSVEPTPRTSRFSPGTREEIGCRARTAYNTTAPA
jgi:hypothetical protein